jgi:polyisoprenyl-teichoic acid--peptidoglycan teichoic acid transferase
MRLRHVKWITTRSVATGLALVAGMLAGWFVLGWLVWPVQWTGATLQDLSPAAREQWLDLVAESYSLDKDSVLAQQRLAGFAPNEQPALMEDIESRVVRRLQGTENILVLGQDQRPGWESWRTDSIMVVVIDYDRDQVGIVSIPRDLWVEIPGYGQQRLNAVDYIGEKLQVEGGGPALAQRVISDTLGIPTQHYVRIHLDGLVKIVDALGGVKVHLDCPLYERTPKDSSPTGYEEFNLPAGDITLDGDEARKFATYRYVTSDFGRTRRQQQLIWAIRNRALEVNLVSRLPELWSALSDLYTTDLDLMDLLRLARFGAGLKPSSVHGLTFTRDVLKDYTTQDGEWVLIVADRAVLDAELERLFLEQPLEQRGRVAAGEECPGPPE